MTGSSRYESVVDPDAPNNAHSSVVRLVGSGQRVLEIGCSVGHVTEQLVRRGNTVVGVEIDADAAEQARGVIDRVLVHDLDAVPLSTVEHDTYDVITVGDVLEHLRDPAATLRDLTTLLAPGGRFVISVPNVAFVDVRLMLLSGRWQYRDVGLLDRTHLRWFTRDGLSEVLADAGLVASHVERVTFWTDFTDLAADRAAVGADVMRYIEADPEAHTFQFVVEAVRRDEVPDASRADALAAPDEPQWPDLAAEASHREAELTALREERDALRAEVEAWRNAKIVRLTRPLRSIYGTIRRISNRRASGKE